MKKWLLFLFLPLLTGCGMATGYFNTQDNGPYNMPETVAYLRKLNIQRSEIYSLNIKGYQSTAQILKKGIPEAELFNSQGAALKWPKARFSLASRLNKLLKTYPGKLPPVDQGNPRKLQDIFVELHDISGKKSQPDAINNYELHLVLYFSLNSESSGDDMLKYCNELLQNNPKTRMKVYLVSMDQQIWWGSKVMPAIETEPQPLSP